MTARTRTQFVVASLGFAALALWGLHEFLSIALDPVIKGLGG